MSNTNFNTISSLFPSGNSDNPYYSSTLYTGPPTCIIRNFSATGSTWQYGWGKNVGQPNDTNNNTGAGGNWGNSNSKTNYYDNDNSSSTEKFVVTFKKNTTTNIYTWIINSDDGKNKFNSLTDAQTTPTFNLNNSTLQLYNASGKPTTTTLDVNSNINDNITNPKITDFNFFQMNFKHKSSLYKITSLKISNIKINDQTITILNRSSYTGFSFYGTQVDITFAIPISQMTSDFKIEFNLNLPTKSFMDSNPDNNKLTFCFGIATPKYKTICLKEDTLIKLSDGSLKEINKIKQGDEILSNNEKDIVLKNVKIKKNQKIRMILFKKDSLDINVPNEDTYVTPGHMVKFYDIEKKAKDYVNDITIVYKYKYINNLHTLFLKNRNNYYFAHNMLCKSHSHFLIN